MAFFKSIVVVVICLAFNTPTLAETSGERIASAVMGCKKAATSLPEGNRYGSLKKSRNASIFSGPSVACTLTSKLTPQTKFIVTGSAKSLFGKAWYQVQVDGQQNKQWVSARHVTLGDVVRLEIGDKEIHQTLVTATLDLNARTCPDTACERVGSLTKGEGYTATKQADNGWYFVSLNNGKEGWVSGKYVMLQSKEQAQRLEQPEDTIDTQQAVVSRPSNNKETKDNTKPSHQQTITLPEQIQQPAVKPIVPKDPCIAKSKIAHYKDKSIWRVSEPLTFQMIPHTQCELTFELTKGNVLINLGETKHYYVIATPIESDMMQGYLRKELFQGQYVSMELYSGKTDEIFTAETVEYLLTQEKYWNSIKYKLLSVWQKFQYLFAVYTAQFLCLFALILGSLVLSVRVLRRKMLRLDQLFIRTLYFSVRSRAFWHMLRRLAFILILSATVLFAMVAYVLWLKEVANLRQMIMGYGSLGLMSLSVGIFGMRVAGFFTGLLLFFLSLFEFLLFVAFLCFLFLLPSLLLLLVYYWSYRKGQKGGEQPQTVFNHEEIERIHERVFRLRNFYPETIISWARRGGVKQRWQSFKDVVRAKSEAFDAFFASVDARFKQRAAS